MPCLPPYNEHAREFTHDIQQWVYQDKVNGEETRAIRAITCITGSDGSTAVTPVRVTENGELVTTTTIDLSGTTLNIDTQDGLNIYGEVNDLAINTEATIVTINVTADKKINIMGVNVDGCGFGDYKLIVGSATQARRMTRKPIEFNFGFYGLTFTGPTTVTLKVKNIDTFLTTSNKNKPHTYFGNVFYSLEDL